MTGAAGPVRRTTFDVIVVGARCSGSALGALLAGRGLRVAVLDRVAAVGYTLSSNILQADSLAFLDRLGLTERLRAAGAVPLTHIDMRLEDTAFVAALPQRPGDAGGAACIRREVLDPLLVEAAREAGADLRFGTRVTGLLTEAGRVVGVHAVSGGTPHELRARLVVGADGRDSTVAALSGSRQYHVIPGERSYYWTYFKGVDTGPDPTFVFHRWGDRHILGGPADSGLYIVGVSPRRHESEAFRKDLEGSVLAHAASCAPIARALRGAERATRIYGIRRFSGYFREASGPGWVLLGDAGHFKDPAGGRGIGDAFDQAQHLATALGKTLHGSDAGIDRVTAAFGRWRDRTYAEYHGLAADLGVAGPIAAVVPRVVGRMHAEGDVDPVLHLLSHRASVLDVLTPGRVLGATGRVLIGGSRRGRRAELTELGALAATELRRRRAVRRPVYARAPGVEPVGGDAATPSPTATPSPGATTSPSGARRPGRTEQVQP
ncbi:NAD(P)/FAD-dependent oxidoreductase [Streptomyces sp. NPDC059578]|uniref:NAD(P)/FAD-dependent oxidoreductase n=1 Tax=Streptomyces sp. NPDC059578 TaxID=3346874 RepID=UPI0036A540C9